MWEFIDHVVFINLDHRTDRLESIQKFFKEGNIPPEKITRFPAIRYTPGIMGAAKSHIGVMNLIKQKGWKNTLILEDDARWEDFDNNYKKLEELVKKPYDILMLGGDYKVIAGSGERILKSYYTLSYIVPFHYVDTLLKNFEEGLNILSIIKVKGSFLKRDPIKIVKNSHQYHIDVYWCSLQARDNWIGIFPSMVKQIESYSDNLNV